MHLIDLTLVLIMLANLALLGSSRLAACIQLSAAQGILLSLLPLAVGEHGSKPGSCFWLSRSLCSRGWCFRPC